MFVVDDMDRFVDELLFVDRGTIKFIRLVRDRVLVLLFRDMMAEKQAVTLE